jgi:hypothetical protein
MCIHLADDRFTGLKATSVDHHLSTSRTQNWDQARMNPIILAMRVTNENRHFLAFEMNFIG